MYVSQAEAGGLTGTYFNNRWLFGSAVFSRVDKTVNFEWPEFITDTGKDFISVRWTGFVQPEFNEAYTFYVEANDGARLWIDDVQLFDDFENEVADGEDFKEMKATTGHKLVAGRLYDILLEYRESKGMAVARLFWSCDTQKKKSIIPSNHLFHTDSPIGTAAFDDSIVKQSDHFINVAEVSLASPFAVTPRGVKPTAPINSALAIKTDTSLTLTFEHPVNDGGTPVTSYRVEWWDTNTGYGVEEVQNIRLLDASGGTFQLEFEGDSTLPLAYEIAPLDVEKALEALKNVGDVVVEAANDAANNVKGFKVTFKTNLKPAAATFSHISVDGAQLTGNSKQAKVCVDGEVDNTFFCDGTSSTTGTAVACPEGVSTAYVYTSGAAMDCVARSELVSMDIENGDQGTYTYTVENLHQLSSNLDGFTVRVAAKNSEGYGVDGAPITLKPEAVPEPPTQVEFARVAFDSTAFTVYWTAPDDQSAAVTDYKVEWATNANFTTPLSHDAAENAWPTARIGTVAITNQGCTTEPLNHCYPGWRQYKILDLSPGTPVYVRVSAKNRMGWGAPQEARLHISSDAGYHASLPGPETPRKVADEIEYGLGVQLATVPADETTSVKDSTQSLRVTWHAPVFEHGSAVDKYKVEWYATPGRDEVQMIQLGGAVTISGTFQIEYEGSITDHLPYNINEVDMAKAINGLTTVRQVQVTRSAANTEWSVTFLADAPAATSSVLIGHANGLATGVTLTIGHGLDETLPGARQLTGTVAVVQNTNTGVISAQTVNVGEYVRIASGADFEYFKVTDYDAGTTTITFDSNFLGASDNANIYAGTTVPGTSISGTKPGGITGGEFILTDVSDGAPFRYTIAGLQVGTAYYCRVSAYNDMGYNAPQNSLPNTVVVPKQKPDVPTLVKLTVSGSASLKIHWNYPEDDGGDTVTKYKIDWDTKSAFDSQTSGTPVGSNEFKVQSSDCKATPCEYTMGSLVKGKEYYVRIYSFNTHGYSVHAALTAPASETPKTQPAPPTTVKIAPATETSLAVSFPASSDDGGGTITKYIVDWDVMGQEGYLAHNGAAVSASALIYSPNEVQTITVKSSEYDLAGYFRIEYEEHATPALAFDISADDMKAALEALPSIGTVSVERVEHLTLTGTDVVAGPQSMSFNGYVWTVEFSSNTGYLGWSGDIPSMTVSTDEYALATSVSFSSSQNAGTLCSGSAHCSVTVDTTVEGMAGFEQQTVTISTAAGAVEGKFTLTFEGKTTLPLAHDISAADMKTALEGLGNMGELYVTHEWKEQVIQRQWTIVFLTKLGNQPAITYNKDSLTNSVPANSITVQIDEKYVGVRPAMSSALKGTKELSGKDIDGSTISYTIPNLISGAFYHVRVSAWNSVGNSAGKSMYSTPAIAAPAAIPGVPVSIECVPVSGTQLKASWVAPLNNGSMPITKYKVEWDASSGVPEQQVITTSATSTMTGTFALSFGGQFTSELGWDASAESMTVALNALSSIGAVTATRSSFSNNGYSWTVTFTNNVGDLPLLGAQHATTLVGSNKALVIKELVTGTDPSFDQGTVGITVLPLGSSEVTTKQEVQHIFASSEAADLQGTFRVKFMGEELTGEIKHDASAAAMATALQALSTIGTVTVTAEDVQQSTVSPTSRFGRRWHITFTSEMGDVPSLMVQTNAALTETTQASGGDLTGTAPTVEVTEFIKGELSLDYTIGGLESTNSYHVRVSAYNGVGWGSPKIASFASSPSNQPPAKPENAVVSTASGSNAATGKLFISWDAPTEQGGDAVAKYVVEWNDNADFNADAMSTATISTTTGTLDADGECLTGTCSYTISGLTGGSSYYVRVSAYNQFGYGAPANAIPAASEHRSVQKISLTDALTANFELHMGTSAATAQLSQVASAAEVQAALQSLDSVHSVIVTRYDHSNNYDASAVATSAFHVDWLVTFVSVQKGQASDAITAAGVNMKAALKSGGENFVGSGDVAKLVAVAVGGGGNPAVTTVHSGNGLSPSSVTIPVTAVKPTGPTDVTLTVVSKQQLGVSWKAPTQNGGSAVTKYLVEWDKKYNFLNTEQTATVNIATASALSEVVVAQAGTNQFQIGTTDALTSDVYYWVRVSAYTGSDYGYGPAVIAEGSVVTTVTPYKTNIAVEHTEMLVTKCCTSLKPHAQIPYKPDSTSFEISRINVPGQLDIHHRDPTVNYLAYAGVESAGKGGVDVTHFRYEWSENKLSDNKDIHAYNARSLSATDGVFAAGEPDNSPQPCNLGDCDFALGAEIQTLSVYATTSTDIVTACDTQGGCEFKLAFGSFSNQLCTNCITAFDGTAVTINTDLSGDLPTGAQFVVDQDSTNCVFTVSSTQTTSTKITPVSSSSCSQFTGQTFSLHVKPVTGVLSYGISSANLETALNGLEATKFDDVAITREAVKYSPGLGYKWYITFSGFGVSGDQAAIDVHAVDSLASVNTQNGGCKSFPTSLGIQAVVAEDHKGGQLKAGTPYFVRVSYVNSAGVSEATDSTPLYFTEATPALGPRSPPGVPQDVRVWAETDSDSSATVTWKAIDTTNGAPITKYTVEYTSGGELYTDNAVQCVSPDSGNACESIDVNAGTGPFTTTITRAECEANQDGTGNTCQFIGSSSFPCTDNSGEPGIAGHNAGCTKADADIVLCNRCATDLVGDVLTMTSNTRLTAGDRVWVEEKYDGATERPYGCVFNVATVDTGTQVTFHPGHGCAAFDGQTLDIYKVSADYKDVCIAAAGNTPNCGGVVTAPVDGLYSTKITGLTPGRYYEFRVRAFNDQGYSDDTTTAVPTCNPGNEDCTASEGNNRLIIRELPAAPTFQVADIDHELPFTETSVMISFFDTAAQEDTERVDKYKIEWDTSPAFDSKGAKPLSYEYELCSQCAGTLNAGNSITFNAGATENVQGSLGPGAQFTVTTSTTVCTFTVSTSSTTADTINVEAGHGCAATFTGNPIAISGSSPEVFVTGAMDSTYDEDAMAKAVGNVITKTTNAVTDLISYDISRLTRGTTYYVRVSAHNSLGYGPPAASIKVKPYRTSDSPNDPVVLKERAMTVDADERGTSLDVTWAAPVIGGGDPITKYLIEWSRTSFDSYTKEIQTVTTQTNAAAVYGTFRLALNTGACATCAVQAAHTTAVIDAHATAQDMRTAIQNLPNVGTVTVTRSEVNNANAAPGAYPGYVWTITFDSEIGDVADFSVAENNLPNIIATPAIASTQDGTGWSSANNYCGSDPANTNCDGGQCRCPTVAVTSGSGSAFSHTIFGLLPAKSYFVRVSAFHALGYGSRIKTTPESILVPKQLPGKPTSSFHPLGSPTLHLGTSSELRVKFGPPAFDGGDPIVAYHVEWDTVPTFDSGASSTPLGHAKVAVGNMLCQDCVTDVAATTVTVTKDGLVSWLAAGVKFVVDDCEMTVDTVATTHTTVTVVAGHGCRTFSGETQALTVTTLCLDCITAFDATTNEITVDNTKNYGAGDIAPHLGTGVRFYASNAASYSPFYDPDTSSYTSCMFTVGTTATTGTKVHVDEYDYPYPSTQPLTQYATQYQTKHSCESFTTASSITLLTGEYTIKGLTAGTSYYVRVASQNKWKGQGPYITTVPASELPHQAPGLVSDVQVVQGAVAGSSLMASWGSAKGSTSYRVEHFARFDYAPHFGVQETQLVTSSNTPTSGSFTLGFGDVDQPLPGTVSAEHGADHVITSEDLTAHIARGDSIKIGGSEYLVHSTKPFTKTQLPLASAENRAAATVLTLGTTDATYAGTTAKGLTAYQQAVTENLDYMITASDLETALEQLPSLGQVGVARTCGNGNPGDCDVGFIWTVTYVSDMGKQPLLVPNGRKLTGVTMPMVGGDCLAVTRNGEGVKPKYYSSTVMSAETGVSSFSLQSLQMGTPYYVRVAAGNDLGFGAYTTSVSGAVAAVKAPGAVPNVQLSSVSSLVSQVEFEEAASAGGSAVHTYEVEWDISPDFNSASKQAQQFTPTNKIQKITTSAHTGPISGDYTLSVGDFHGDYSVQIGDHSTTTDGLHQDWTSYQDEVLCSGCVTDTATNTITAAGSQAGANLLKYISRDVVFQVELSGGAVCVFRAETIAFDSATSATTITVEAGHGCAGTTGETAAVKLIHRKTFVNIVRNLQLTTATTPVTALSTDDLSITVVSDDWTMFKILGTGVQFDVKDVSLAKTCRFKVVSRTQTGTVLTVKVTAVAVDGDTACPVDSTSDFTGQSGSATLLTAVTRYSPDSATDLGDAFLNRHIARGDYIRVGGQEFRICLDTTIGAYDEANLPLCKPTDAWTSDSYTGLSRGGSRETVDLVQVPAYKLDTSLGSVVAPALGDTTISPSTFDASGGSLLDISRLARGDYIRLGHPTEGQTFRINTDEAKTFDATTIPLASLADPTKAQSIAQAGLVGATREVQKFTISGNAALKVGEGGFRLKFDTEITAKTTAGGDPGCMLWDSGVLATDAAAVEAELEALSNIDDVSVSRSDTALGVTYTVTFVGSQVRGNVPLLEVLDLGANDCQAFDEAVAANGAVVQNANPAVVSEESWSAFYEVQTTVPIAFDAEAADVKSAIEGLTEACTVDVTRTISENGYDWSVTFTADNENVTSSLLLPMSANGVLVLAAGTGLQAGSPYLTAGTSTNPAHVPDVTVSGITKFDIGTPKTGSPYYARVRAVNAAGKGEWSSSVPVSLVPSSQTPTAPELARLSVLSNSEFLVEWMPPVSDGGQAVSKYIVEWDTDSKFDSAQLRSTTVLSSATSAITDVQHITSEVPVGFFMTGTFTITYLGQKTRQLQYDISAADMEAELEKLCTVEDVSVTRNIVARGHTWLITFTSMKYAGNLQTRHDSTDKHQVLDSHRLSVNGDHLLMCDTEDVTSTKTAADRSKCYRSKVSADQNVLYPSIDVATRREVQSFVCTVAGGNTFTLSFMGKTTTAIAAEATALDVENALEALDTVGDVSVTFTGGQLEACENSVSAKVSVTFESELGDLPPMTATGAVTVTESTAGRTQPVVGQLSYSAIISESLVTTSDKDWFVRVSAFNSVGYGKYASTMPSKAEPTVNVATVPRNVAFTVGSSTSLIASWDTPITNGGSAITDYEVQWDTVDSFTSHCGERAEVQRVTFTDVAAGATFKLALTDAAGNTIAQTACLVDTSSANDVRNAIMTVMDDEYDGVLVTKCDQTESGNNANGYTFDITFAAQKNIPLNNVGLLTPSVCVGTGTISAEVTRRESLTDRDPLLGTGRDALQCSASLAEPLGTKTTSETDADADATALTLKTADRPTARAFTIKHLTPGLKYWVRVVAINGNGRSPVSHSGASTVAVPADVPDVPTMGALTTNTEASLRVQYAPPANVKREGSNGKKVNAYTVELAHRVFEEQKIVVKATGGPITSGAFKVKVVNNGATLETSCLAWDVDAAAMQLALNQLVNIDGVSVSRSAYSVVDAPNGYVFTIVFDGARLCNGDIADIDVVYNDASCASDFSVSNGESVTTAKSVEGVAGFVPEVVTVTTTADDRVAGKFDLSVNYNGEFTKALCSNCGTVLAGTKILSTDTDLTGKINRGDKIKIGDEIFRVDMDADFNCNEVPLDSYHIGGAVSAGVFTEDTAVGHVEWDSGVIKTGTTAHPSDYRNQLQVGDFIRVGPELHGQEFLIKDIDATSITLGRSDDKNCHPNFAVGGCTADSYTLAKTSTKNPTTLYMRKKITVRSDIDSYILERELETKLPGVGTVEVSRSGPDNNNGFVWTISFTSHNGAFQCPSYTAGGTNGKVTASPCLVSQKSAADGSSNLYNNVILAGASANVYTGYALARTNGMLENGVVQLGIAPSFATIAKSGKIEGSVDEVQTITTSADSDNLDGTFTVTFDDKSIVPTYNCELSPPQCPSLTNKVPNSVGAGTVAFEHDVTAEDMKKKFERDLPTMGIVDVTRVGDLAGYGYVWTVRFKTNFGDLPLMVVDYTNLAGTNAKVTALEIVKGVPPTPEYVADGLTNGVAYHARVVAHNDIGKGAYTTDVVQNAGQGILPLQKIVRQPPLAPVITSSAAISDSQIQLSFTPPASRGSDIHTYRLEWSKNANFGDSEIKTITLTNDVEADTDGYFTVVYAGQETIRLAHDCNAADMQAALNSLSNLGSVEVSRSEVSSVGSYGYSWTATFTQNIGALRTQAADYANALHAVITPARTVTTATAGSAVITFSDTEGIAAGDKFLIDGDYIESAEYEVQSVNGLDVTMTTQWPTASNTIYEVAISVPACKAIGTTVTRTSFGASTTTSITEKGTITLVVDDTTAGTTQGDYGSVDLQTSPDCGSHVVGKPSSVQIVRLFTNHDDLFNAGGYRLELDGMKTACIGPTASAVDVQLELEALASVVSERTKARYGTHGRRVSVETIATRTVGFKHDYRISFWSKYAEAPNNAATDYWPTIKVLDADFGSASALGCPAFASAGGNAALNAHSALVHSLKVEGPCAGGNKEVQVIVAEAEGTLGGSFTVIFDGTRTEAVSVDSSAAQVKAILEKWFSGTEVDVALSNHRNKFSKAWAVTFTGAGPKDRMRINGDFVTGTDATVAVYDMVTVTTSADGGMTDGNLRFANIQGEFTLQMGTEITRPLRHDVTHAKVVQELERLNGFAKVEFFGTEQGRTALHETVSVSKYVTDATQTNAVISFSDVDGLVAGDKCTIEGAEYEVASISTLAVTMTQAFAGTTVTGRTEQNGQRIFCSKIVATGDLTSAVAETNGDKLGDTVFIPAVESQIITAQTGVQNIRVPKGIVPAPEGAGGDKYMIGGQKVTVTAVDTSNADYDQWTCDAYNGANVVEGNPIVKITGMEYVVNSISYDATTDKSVLTLDRTYESSAAITASTADNTETAAFGHLVYSKKALPGCMTLESTMHVVAATTDSAAVTFSDVTGVVPGSKFTIAGQEFEVAAGAASVDATTKIVTMKQTYNGASVVLSSPATKIYGNVITTSADLRSLLDVDAAALGKMMSLKIWLGLDEFTVAANSDLTSSTITVSGPVSTDYICSTGSYWANGYERAITLKAVLGDVNTFRAIPEANWRGTNARLQVARPEGVSPYTYVLGTPSEVQTVALRDTSDGDHGTGKWRLELGEEQTIELSWNAAVSDLKAELEKLALCDRVNVERNGDGSALSLYGYTYTVTFWGVSAYPNIPQMTSSKNGLSTAVIRHNTVRQGTAAAHYLQSYLSLRDHSSDGGQYWMRIAAANAEGFGPVSTAVTTTTADVGVIPGTPRAVSLGDAYTANSLSLYWDAPSNDGGSDISKYRVEWDSSTGFDSSSPHYGESTVSLVHEVQHVVVSFRSLDGVISRDGSFTLSWGGRETPALPWNIDQTTMAERLQDLTGTTAVGQNPIKVVRSDYARGYRWAVTFRGLQGNIGQMEADYHMLVGDKPHVEVIEVTPGSADLTPGDYTMEVQTIRTESLSVLGGTFRLTFENRQTEPIAFDANAMPQDGGTVGESMKEKLEALTTIHSVNVVKETFDDAFGWTAWTVTFTHVVHELEQGAGNVGLFLADYASLTGNSAKVAVSEAVKGTDQMNFVIGNLITGTMYHARVTAYNSRGNGPLSAVSSAMPRTQPSAPTSPTLAVASATSLQLAWMPPQSNGGDAVDKYRVEWYTAPGISEKQTITTSAEAHVKEVQTVRVAAAEDNLGGYFKLSFKGETTDNIAFNAPAVGAKSVKEKLERLSTVGTVSVTRDYSKTLIQNFLVDATNCVNAATPCILNDCTDAAGTTVACNTVLQEAELLWVASGKYRVKFGGNNVNDIELALVEDATGNTQATFPDESADALRVFKWAKGYEWTIEFTSHVGNQPELVPSTSNNWAGTLPTLKVQTTRQGLQPLSGNFRVTMGA